MICEERKTKREKIWDGKLQREIVKEVKTLLFVQVFWLRMVKYVQQSGELQSMDLHWLGLIIPAAYIIVSLVFLCLAPCHKHKYRHRTLNALICTERVLCIGHRGGGYEGPENTLQLFRKTAPISHMFELDVCETNDHKLVVHHDTNLSRTTGRHQSIKELNYDDLPPFKDEIVAFGSPDQMIIKTTKNRIPLLDELFAEFPQQLMNIDLKTPTDTAIQEFTRIVRKHGRQDFTVWGAMGDEGCTNLRSNWEEVTCFYSGWEILKIFLLTVSGLLPFWPLRLGVLDIPLYCDGLAEVAYKFAGTNCRKVLVCLVLQILRFFNLVSRLFIPHLRKRGILTFYWICNDRDSWERAISMGCRGIMTDQPSKLAAFLKQKGLFFEEEGTS